LLLFGMCLAQVLLLLLVHMLLHAAASITTATMHADLLSPHG
jgi:hypothetical protein